jgi:RHH-type proline utilization regulon transcriptional repressor/proline dehydrogenase/delta 1-pyrroline-5-carboxylate dehydrogenase
MATQADHHPTYGDPAGLSELADLSDEAISTVERWLEVAAEVPADTSAKRLATMLRDPQGLPFTVRFIDRVIRPEDTRTAAREFAALAKNTPGFVPWHLRLGIRVGAVVGLVLPMLVIPVVRRALRRMVGHLVVDARDKQLGLAIAKLRRSGTRLNLNLLGEAVLGEREAARRLEGTHRLLARGDVDYVSIKVSATVAPQSPWAFDETVAHVVDQLGPLYRRAAESSPRKFINLDMEEYHDLHLTIAVFKAILDQPEFVDLEAGIVLQAYLPDALAAMMDLQEWADARRSRGGAPIKVRVVKGANLPMERVDSSVHEWPLATWHTKQDSDTNYKRLLDYAMRPDRVRNIRIGVAGHNLFDVAFAWLLADRRGVRDEVEFEMLLGMAQGQAEAVRRDVGGLLLYTPVVHPGEFDVAIAYLVRRLEEGASHDNFMSAVFNLHDDARLFARERDRFLASLAALDRSVPSPNRDQDRQLPVGDDIQPEFRNVADTDPSLPANRAWGREILSRVPTSKLGIDLVNEHTLRTRDEVDAAIATASSAGTAWGARSGAERAAVLRRVAVALERRRPDLLEVMAVECGKTLAEGDPEVSEAIDFANYYASRAEALDQIDGAVPKPAGVTVVTPPWNFPLAIPAGSTLAALAAGSGVITKPASQSCRTGALMVDTLWAAGVPRDVLQLVQLAERDFGRQLVSDPRVGRLILTGSYETAELFRSFRPDLPLLAETSGKNAIIVTPSADLDLAARDVVRSAFGHAGQKCSAASLVIVVGPVATSKRFRNQLVDAVASLRVGSPADPTTQMGPIIGPAEGKLLHALTVLEPGESWVVEPKRLDDEGRVWSPGVKEGVAPGSPYHLTEYFGPVLGIMTAPTLERAIELQNQVAYGLTAGLHTLDPDDLDRWLDRVQAGNVYVNRGITGAVVRRQPFGGWKRSAVGAGSKAGGPNYVIGLTDWEPATAHATAEIPEATEGLLAAARSAGLESVDGLERALRSDAEAWAAEFGAVRDVTGLLAERNVFRYRPHPVTIRHASGPVTDLVRLVAAGVLAGAELTVSTAAELRPAIVDALAAVGVPPTIEDDAAWSARVSTIDAARIRLVGGSTAQAYGAVSGRPDVAIYGQPVTESGRIELLPFLKEQAVSITAHRFGTPDRLSDDVLRETETAARR